MTQPEIERQILDVLKSKSDEVHCSSVAYKDWPGLGGFGLAPVKYEPVSQGPVQRYVHKLFVTKEYRDWTCAAFKLYRFCESLPRTEKMFIRREPTIEKNPSFERSYLTWNGSVRFANKPEEK